MQKENRTHPKQQHKQLLQSSMVLEGEQVLPSTFKKIYK